MATIDDGAAQLSARVIKTFSAASQPRPFGNLSHVYQWEV
jgi:hypothetical protein